jgi:hypothetical protein
VRVGAGIEALSVGWPCSAGLGWPDWSGGQGDEGFQQSNLGQLYAEPQFAAFAAGLGDCCSDLCCRAGIDADAFGLLRRAWPIFQRPGALAVFLRDAQSKELLDEPGAVLVVEAGDDVSAVQTFSQTANGRVLWGVVGSRIWLARGEVGRALLAEQLRDTDGHSVLGDDVDYRRARDRLDMPTWLFGVHLRVAAVRDSLMQQVHRSDDDALRGRADFLAGLCDVLVGDGEWLTFASGFVGPQFRWGLFLATERDRGLAELFYRRPVDRNSLLWVPRSATFCLSANLDLRTVEYRFLSLFLRERAAGRHTGLAMVEWLSHWLEKRLGVEIRREILSQLEPTWVFYTVPSPRDPDRISRVLVLQTPDGELFRRSCERLADALRDRLGQQVIYYDDPPPGRWELAAGTVNVAWAVAGQCVAVSDSPAALQEVFDRGGQELSRKRSILGRPDAAQALQAVPESASLLSFSDTREQVTQFLRYYKRFRLANMEGPAAGFVSRLPEAPPIQVIRRHLTSGEVMSLTHYPEGVVFAGQGDLPFRLGVTIGAGVGVVTAAAITLYGPEPPPPPPPPEP